MFELRPLSLGELLDRSFAVYRSRFWLFASIAAIAASVQVVVQAISLATTHALLRNSPILHPNPVLIAGPSAARASLAGQLGTWAAGLIFFLVNAVTQAAITLALSEVYLNHAATAKEALRVAWRRWYRWIAIALWQSWSMAYVPLLALIPAVLLLAFGTRSGNTTLTVIGGVLAFVAIFGGFPFGFVLYLRNTLAVPAAMVEKLPIRAAMRRSKGLTVGTKGRIFMVLLIAVCLYGVVAVLESPATLLLVLAPKEEHYTARAITLVISFFGNTVVAPIAAIGLTLVYFDQRVRKEALDLQLLLENSRRTGAVGPVAGPPPPVSEGIAPLG